MYYPVFESSSLPTSDQILFLLAQRLGAGWVELQSLGL